MLELKEIRKDYQAGSSKVEALKGISLAFRKNEFVSILGPSGCGKTTLLNIIGGLDHVSGGDLLIDGVSTKNYSDRDWDTYRNHRVGFVFQSYNLIPHQTVLSNVELALTISGIDKKERVERAKKALDKVGLKDHYNKKPSQLSGGQCQRVAIARALVNNPEILLADEPTGALDSETSIQIMELIKEISKDCLVIMVTHNPELAERYSSRIIRVLDGQVQEDTNPYKPEKEEVTTNKKNVSKKSKLSFWNAFKLSAKNLYSKFKRTFLVCLAGSIGIIGVATVLALSTGVQGFIQSMQDDMLSGNPVTISEEGYNLNALMEMSSNSSQQEALENSIEDGKINVNSMVDYLVQYSGNLSSLMLENEITEEYIDYVYSMPKEYYSAIVSYFGLELSNNLYTTYKFNEQENNNMSLTTALQIYTSMLEKTDYASFASYIPAFTDGFMQAPDNEEFILSQYNIVSGEGSKIATEANEIMLVLDDDSSLSDLLLAQLGYFSQDEFFNIVYKATDDPNYDESIWKDTFTFDELLGKTFTWYPNDVVFNKTDESLPNASMNPFTYNAYESSDWTGGVELTITAILMPKEDISYGCLDSGIYYTSALAEYVIQQNLNSEIVQYFVDNEIENYNSFALEGINFGITYEYSYEFEGVEYSSNIGFVGSTSSMDSFFGSMGGGQGGPTYHTITLRELGGCVLPNEIAIYPTDFDYKDEVTAFLDVWNSDADIVVNGVTITAEERNEIQYTDNLALVISVVNTLISVVTTALVAFTALSLVVSTVMIAIITYVSVMERVKEIGVIRSLGGRKRDVSNLFIAETLIIGGISGVFGVVVTYILSGIINLIVGSMFGIYGIAFLPITTALIMIAISILLTTIAGLIPARHAAKKDPAEALRSE